MVIVCLPEDSFFYQEQFKTERKIWKWNEKRAVRGLVGGGLTLPWLLSLDARSLLL